MVFGGKYGTVILEGLRPKGSNVNFDGSFQKVDISNYGTQLGTFYSFLWEGYFDGGVVVHFRLTSKDASALYVGSKLILDNLGKLKTP